MSTLGREPFRERPRGGRWPAVLLALALVAFGLGAWQLRAPLHATGPGGYADDCGTLLSGGPVVTVAHATGRTAVPVRRVAVRRATEPCPDRRRLAWATVGMAAVAGTVFTAAALGAAPRHRFRRAAALAGATALIAAWLAVTTPLHARNQPGPWALSNPCGSLLAPPPKSSSWGRESINGAVPPTAAPGCGRRRREGLALASLLFGLAAALLAGSVWPACRRDDGDESHPSDALAAAR